MQVVMVANEYSTVLQCIVSFQPLLLLVAFE